MPVKSATVVLTAMVCGARGLTSALDCGARLVSLGRAPWELHAICGEPAQLEDTLPLIHQPVYGPLGRMVDYLPMAVPRSVWTFNFGSSRLVYLLTFVEGILVNIETRGYGHSRGKRGGGECTTIASFPRHVQSEPRWPRAGIPLDWTSG